MGFGVQGSGFGVWGVGFGGWHHDAELKLPVVHDYQPIPLAGREGLPDPANTCNL